MKYLKNLTAMTMVVMFALTSTVDAKVTGVKSGSGFDYRTSSMVKSSGTFDGNRIYADVTNNGLILDYHISGDSALEWPKGTGVHSIFQSALWLAALVDTGTVDANGDPVMQSRVAAGTYTQDMGPGPYAGDSAVHRVYKVAKEMMDDPENHTDFQEWPAEFGAPWVDVDGDGSYNPLPEGTDHPDFVGDQMLWFVSSDKDPLTKQNFNTGPLGVEVQTTMFGFDRIDAIGDMLFVKMLVMNKGENDLEDMYLGVWSDPDLGYAGDDLVGSNPELGYGYVYNDGFDRYYDNLDIRTPAVGYDFFQGPKVPCRTDLTNEDGDPIDDPDCTTEGAKMYGQYFPGEKNLKMSSFAFYINSDQTFTDPEDEDEVYNYMKGKMKDGSDYDETIVGDQYGGNFVFWGDPSQEHGVSNPVDGNYAAAADRRFLMNVGPFTMDAPSTPGGDDGDQQEIVFGIFHAAGGGALESVAFLEEVNVLAQSAYDNDFDLPELPKKPKVEVTALADQIILQWDENSDQVESYFFESFFTDPDGNETDYDFEGYVVYQAETADGSGERKRVATYDVKNRIRKIETQVYDTTYGQYIDAITHFGTDSGLKRYHVFNADALNSNSNLVTNREYYLAVTAYAYNEYGSPRVMESNPRWIAVRPEVHNTMAMNDESLSPGESMRASHDGPGDGYVEVKVVNPMNLTGDEYGIQINDTMPDGSEVLNWTFTNLTTGVVKVENNTVFSGIDYGNDNLDEGVDNAGIFDGFQLLVNGPPDDLASVQEWEGLIAADGTASGDVFPDGTMRDNAVSFQPASLGRSGYLVENRGGNWNVPAYGFDFDRFDYWESDDVELDFSGESLAWDYYYEWTNGLIPFAMYRHNFASGNKEPLFASFWDRDADFALSIAMIQDTDADGNPLVDENGDPVMVPRYTGPKYGAPSYEPIFAFASKDGVNFYDPANNAQYIADDDLRTSGGCGWADTGCPGALTTSGRKMTYPYVADVLMTMYLGTATLPTKEGFAARGQAADYPSGSSVVFRKNKPLSGRDSFSFDTSDFNMDSMDYSPDAITVWPNPYYGYNPEERDALDRRVMFSHLPESGEATIRIYALDGTLVRTVKHNDAGTQHTYWDMKNNFGLPVASGMYIAHVETNKGDKTLKLAVIQPEQRLDVY